MVQRKSSHTESEIFAAVIGGCGHVGLPLGIRLALAGIRTVLVDINAEAVAQVQRGRFPFVEKNGNAELQRALAAGLTATSDPSICADVNAFIFSTGTPVDEHLNPKISTVISILEQYEKYFRRGDLIIMRSTLYPRTMEHLKRRLDNHNVSVSLAFCPERVAQGIALEETCSLPQIIAAFDEESFQGAYKIFSLLAPSIIRLSPLEAEMAKLMANSWRYLEFAIANQFYMIAEANGVDFYRVYEAIRHEYPRAKGYKAPGFAAGPCLFKDTMQLASFFDHKFYLGHAAMLVNEGLANFVVERAKHKLQRPSLWNIRVGLLGMTFKANNDDIRESLSFRVKKALEFEGAEVNFHDPYLAGSKQLDDLLKDCQLLILCTPHDEYRNLRFTQPMIDVWGLSSKPRLEILSGQLAASKVSAG